MDTMAVTKQDMGLLSKEQLTQATFGALCQSFAMQILSRGRYEDGMYQRVALEFLEEDGQSQPTEIKNVFNVDLSLVLETIRQETLEQKQVKKETERLLEQVIQVSRQAEESRLAKQLSPVEKYYLLQPQQTRISHQYFSVHAPLSVPAGEKPITVSRGQIRALAKRAGERAAMAPAVSAPEQAARAASGQETRPMAGLPGEFGARVSDFARETQKGSDVFSPREEKNTAEKQLDPPPRQPDFWRAEHPNVDLEFSSEPDLQETNKNTTIEKELASSVARTIEERVSESIREQTKKEKAQKAALKREKTLQESTDQSALTSNTTGQPETNRQTVTHKTAEEGAASEKEHERHISPEVPEAPQPKNGSDLFTQTTAAASSSTPAQGMNHSLRTVREMNTLADRDLRVAEDLSKLPVDLSAESASVDVLHTAYDPREREELAFWEETSPQETQTVAAHSTQSAEAAPQKKMISAAEQAFVWSKEHDAASAPAQSAKAEIRHEEGDTLRDIRIIPGKDTTLTETETVVVRGADNAADHEIRVTRDQTERLITALREREVLEDEQTRFITIDARIREELTLNQSQDAAAQPSPLAPSARAEVSEPAGKQSGSAGKPQPEALAPLATAADEADRPLSQIRISRDPITPASAGRDIRMSLSHPRAYRTTVGSDREKQAAAAGETALTDKIRERHGSVESRPGGHAAESQDALLRQIFASDLTEADLAFLTEAQRGQYLAAAEAAGQPRAASEQSAGSERVHSSAAERERPFDRTDFDRGERHPESLSRDIRTVGETITIAGQSMAAQASADGAERPFVPVGEDLSYARDTSAVEPASNEKSSERKTPSQTVNSSEPTPFKRNAARRNSLTDKMDPAGASQREKHTKPDAAGPGKATELAREALEKALDRQITESADSVRRAGMPGDVRSAADPNAFAASAETLAGVGREELVFRSEKEDGPERSTVSDQGAAGFARASAPADPAREQKTASAPEPVGARDIRVLRGESEETAPSQQERLQQLFVSDLTPADLAFLTESQRENLSKAASAAPGHRPSGEQEKPLTAARLSASAVENPTSARSVPGADIRTIRTFRAPVSPAQSDPQFREAPKWSETSLAGEMLEVLLPTAPGQSQGNIGFPLPGQVHGAETSAAAPASEELTYAPAAAYQPASTPAAPAAAVTGTGHLQSDYAKNLPSWAQDFLKNGPSIETQAAKIGGVSAMPSAAGSITSQAFPESSGGEEIIDWSAPGRAQAAAMADPRRATDMTFKEKAQGQAHPQQPVRLSESELRRTADKIYNMIEDRIRRERRLLGL